MRKVAVIIISAILLLPVLALARIGVGVGTGKIVVDQPLKPGLIYTLPSLSVLNTGDEPGEYGASIQYHEGQETRSDMGFKPAAEWFTFEPSQFHLEPGQSQQVQIKLSLPVKGVKPGTYFAYLEGHPVKKDVAGQTSIGVAAAAKLYFIVAPANIFQGIYYRFISLYSRYHPWDTVILAIIFATILIFLFRKRFKIQIARKE
jgi:hypothetical protein